MNFLETIVEHKRSEVAQRKQKIRRSALEQMQYYHRPSLPFREALMNKEPFAIIAEIKRSSPSAGTLKNNVDPARLAQEYQVNGAAAISVLTDERFFSGTLNDLHDVRGTVTLPILRKEFIIDDYQISEAKAYGADAILLIAAILERSELQEFFLAAKESHIECLVELCDEHEIDKLDFDVMKLVGINNRDLTTMTIDIGRTFNMKKHIPDDITVVSESGIRSANELKKLKAAGVTSALIGEHFMKSDNPAVELRKLLDSISV